MKEFRRAAVVPFVLSVCLFGCASSWAVEPCRILVVDQANGWPVPLVELTTTHNVSRVSDNAGVIAMDLPELMGVESWFHVKGHGYEVPADGFGYRGVQLTPTPGETLTVSVKRTLPAKRLGRITGAGLFAESQKLGDDLDWSEQHIMGCDSVQNAVHGGKMHWAWGDTNLANYPLGRFQSIGAVTPVQPLDSFEPPIRLRYDYHVDENSIPRNTAEMPGPGPTWLSGLASVVDQKGAERLVATYAKIRPPLETYETGFCILNDEEDRFDRHRVLWTQTEDSKLPPPMPNGHCVRWQDGDGQEWLLFGDPFPTIKCRPTLQDLSNPDSWEHLASQTRVPVKGSTIEIEPHRGSIAWNAYREKWVTVFTQRGGKSSFLGEIWYAESDSPTGPWGDAVHVVTHDKYTFYNPKLHPEFTPAGSSILLFEGTYTHTFSGNPTPTARHDYNQVLYRLDLDAFGE